jgi:hypothetical protein
LRHATERAGDSESKTVVEADGTDVVLPYVKVRKLSVLRDPVHDSADQHSGIASSTVAWVRAYSADFSTAWDRGTLARHRAFANAESKVQYLGDPITVGGVANINGLGVLDAICTTVRGKPFAAR